MATPNSTGNEEQTSFEDMHCSAVFKKEINNQLIFFSAVHSILSITAFLGNTLRFIRRPKLLLRSLATTDLCVSIIVEPLFVIILISLVNERWNICSHAFDVGHLTGYSLCSVSLFTSTAISVDRLLALLLGLRYRQVVTLKRMCLTVTLSWVVSQLDIAP